MGFDDRSLDGRRVRRAGGATAFDDRGEFAPPRPVVDGRDRHVWLDRYGERDREALVEMYRAFPPADRTLGLPPAGESAIRDWLTAVADGTSILAHHDGDAVGHALFVPTTGTRYELGHLRQAGIPEYRPRVRAPPVGGRPSAVGRRDGGVAVGRRL